MKVNHIDNIGEQRLVQWWEHSPPTSVAKVQILSISDIIMLVEFVVGSLSCSARFSPKYFGFPFSLRTDTWSGLHQYV